MRIPRFTVHDFTKADIDKKGDGKDVDIKVLKTTDFGTLSLSLRLLTTDWF